MIPRTYPCAIGVLVLLVHAEITWAQTMRAELSAPAEFRLGHRLPSPGAVREATDSASRNGKPAGHNSPAGLELRSGKFGRNGFGKTVSSVCVAAGLMLAFLWLSRRMRSDQAPQVPDDLVEVVGQVPLDVKHRAHLVRFGDRLLLLSLQGTGVSKLGEIPFAAWSDAPGTGQRSPMRLPHGGDPALAQPSFTLPNG